MKPSILFLLLLLAVFGKTQSTFRTTSTLIDLHSEIYEKSNGNLLVTALTQSAASSPASPFSFSPAVHEFSPTGDLISAVYFADENNLNGLFAVQDKLLLTPDNKIYTSFFVGASDTSPAKSGVIKINDNNEVEWFTKVRTHHPSISSFPMTGLSNGNILAYTRSPKGFGLSILNDNGVLLSDERVVFDFLSNNNIPVTRDLVKTQDNRIITAGFVNSINNQNISDFTGFVATTNQNGLTTNVHTVDSVLIANIDITPDENLIIVGNRLNPGNTSEPVVIKTDSSGNVIFAYVLPYYGNRNKLIGGKTAQNGDILLAIQEVNYPFTVLVRFNPDFTLKFSKVYPGSISAATPEITELEDGGIIFSTIQDTESNGMTVRRTILTKTDSLGNIIGVPIKEACFDDPIPIEIAFTNRSFTILDSSIDTFNPDISTFPIEILDGNVTDPPFPLPDFLLPDTICLDNCALVAGLKNEFADTWDWSVEGTTVDFPQSEEPGSLCWSEPGDYTVRQIISFQNCLDTFVQRITVLPDINLTLPDSVFLCPDENLTLDGYSQNATSYLWNNGISTSEIIADTVGTYILTATNGYCSQSDTTLINILPFSQDFVPSLSLSDTALCLSDFPLSVNASLMSSQSGYWENGDTTPLRNIFTPGSYTFTATTENCEFSTTLNLLEIDCRDRLYLPTAFSPDFDGINDLWKPEGTNFTATELTVYDRWGNLLLHSTDPLPEWDGTKNGEPLPDGVYVIVLRYVNSIDGTVKMVGADVSLIR